MSKIICKACGASFASNKALVVHVGSAHPDILDDALAQYGRKVSTPRQEGTKTSELAKSIAGLVTTTDHLVQTLLLDIIEMKDIIEKLKGKKE